MINHDNHNEPFPDEETFEKIYSECLNRQRISKGLQSTFTLSQRQLEQQFENYLALIEKEQFRFAYECGWKAGRESRTK